jgi:hypothetical protein
MPILSGEHLAELRGSGLSDETIQLAGLRTEQDPVAVKREMRWPRLRFDAVPALVIPYFDVRGKRLISFIRIKPRAGFKFKADDEKGPKYLSPTGGGQRVYLPPFPSLHATIADRFARLLITEGEKKTLCANQAGFACVGLGGVWNWAQKRDVDPTTGRKCGPRVLLPEFAAIRWDGRAVYIAFDSDAADNPLIVAAELALAKTLQGRGARVHIVRNPTYVTGRA